MGSLVSGLVGLFEGDPAQQQEAQLNSLSNYETGVGEGLTTSAAGFDEAILSGDPTRIAQALAPQISGQQTQIQQAANKNAQFGTRSGGTAASTAGAEGAGRANLINLEGGLQSQTADSAGSLGSNLLSQSSKNVQADAAMKQKARANQLNEIGGVAQGVAEIASMGMDMGADTTTPPSSIPSSGAGYDGSSGLSDFGTDASGNSPGGLSGASGDAVIYGGF